MKNQKSLGIIEKTKKENKRELNLVACDLTSFPAKIVELVNLELLNLEGNRLTCIPPDIAKLSNLTTLKLGKNRLIELPEEVKKLSRLNYLSLWGNQLTQLPTWIENLAKLTHLNLWGNKLQSLPKELGKLNNLLELHLGRNVLKQLPCEIGDLSNLELLNVEENKLTCIPKEIAKLFNLATLNLGSNKLRKLPIEIAKLTKLFRLNLSCNDFFNFPLEIEKIFSLKDLEFRNNRLVSLPPEIGNLTNLQMLSVSNNQLTKLPKEISNLANLKVLYLAQNQIEELPVGLKRLDLDFFTFEENKIRIPEEIFYRSPKELIKYILDLQFSKEKKHLHEAKLIFVGAGEVGKTSLVHRLTKDIFNPNELKTEGVEIVDWAIQLEKKQIKLHVWDFGGQEIMHATHHFFMTRRSVYILVINPRSDDRYRNLEMEYWLKLIGSYGGNSPIIVVINKIDTGKMSIGKGSLQDHFPNIVGFVETSCKENIGIENLIQVIKKSVEKLPHLDDLLPASYFKIKNMLEQTNKEYLDYRDYEDICKSVDAQMSAVAMKTLIGLLHDLGTMLNFQEDRHLEETQVLNPQWATQGAYQIINSPILQKNKGVLFFDEASEILASDRYPTKRVQGFIMDLMKHFQLCYQMPEKKDTYFIPGSFPKDPPEHFSWDPTDTLRFQYHYDIMPASIISNFIVRMHDLIKDNNYWRNGVVIEHENNLAFIKANPNDEKILIEVKGKEKKITLAFIRGQLQIIHNNLSKISVEQMIPLDEESKIVVEYDRLIYLLDRGRKVYDCYELKKDFSIRKLLGNFEVEVDRNNILNSQEIEALVQDCAKSLTKSQVHLALMKLNIPPAKIVYCPDLVKYYRNIICYLMDIGKLAFWLEQLQEYLFAQKWLQILRQRSIGANNG